MFFYMNEFEIIQIQHYSILSKSEFHSKYKFSSIYQLITYENMIQNDIDLLDQQNIKDSYYFAIKLINLKKNKKKPLKAIKNSHFKFLIEQDDYIIDQTKQKIMNMFSALRTNVVSLNNQILFFYLSDVKQSNAEFQLKMYIISHQEVQEIGQTVINSLTYIEIFLEDRKNIFRETTSLSGQFTLQYEVYVGKNKLEIQNLITNIKDDNQQLKNAFKKKTNQVIQIDNQKIQVKEKTSPRQIDLLKKSLYVDTKKLIQVKKRKMELKQRSQQKNKSKSSIFQKIGNIFMSKAQQITGSRVSRHQSSPDKKFTQSQKSFAVSPPAIGPHKFYRPQNKSHYHNLQLKREKQRERLQIIQNTSKQSGNTPQLKECESYGWLKVFKVAIFILFFTILFYYLASPSKKARPKSISPFQFLNF